MTRFLSLLISLYFLKLYVSGTKQYVLFLSGSFHDFYFIFIDFFSYFFLTIDFVFLSLKKMVTIWILPCWVLIFCIILYSSKYLEHFSDGIVPQIHFVYFSVCFGGTRTEFSLMLFFPYCWDKILLSANLPTPIEKKKNGGLFGCYWQQVLPSLILFGWPVF